MSKPALRATMIHLHNLIYRAECSGVLGSGSASGKGNVRLFDLSNSCITARPFPNARCVWDIARTAAQK